MLTNNWNSCIGYLFGNTDTTNKNISGINGGLAAISYTSWFEIGTGTTPAKRTDYKMEASIDNSKYTAAFTKGYSKNFELENSYFQLQCLITNVSEEDLSFSEIGFIAKNSSQNYATNFLIAREVFETPIVLAPGETKTFILKLI